MCRLNAVFPADFLAHVKVQIVSRVTAVDKQNTLTLINRFCCLINQFRIRRCTDIPTAGSICQAGADIPRKQWLMTAPTANHDGYFVFSMPPVHNCIIIFNLMKHILMSQCIPDQRLLDTIFDILV